MSRLDELIEKLCPKGVEYLRLEELCNIKGRIGFRGYTRQDQVEPGNGAISLSPTNIQDGEICYNNCTYISWQKYEESPEIQVCVGDILFGKTASVGKTALVKYLPEKATINPQLVVLKNIQCNNVYLSYALKTKEFQDKVDRIKGLGTIPTISQKDFASLTVPVPPLPVQHEIVRILDSFTELTAELTAELTIRLKQYEHYLNNLLSKIDETLYETLSNVATVKRGIRVVRSQLVNEGNYPVYQNGLIPLGYHTEKNCESETTFVICAGAAGDVGYSAVDFWAADDCHYIPSTERLLSRYLFHILLWKQPFLYSQVRKGSIPRLSRTVLEKLKIPVPTIQKQREISQKLDTFYSLCNDSKHGLPAEIAARQKQYEYYRDKLLTFKPLS